jgi:hypothetical protein
MERVVQRVYEEAVADLRTQLGEEIWQEVRDEGRAMSMEEAVEYALEGS